MALTLNIKQFEEIRDGEVFASGVLPNAPEGIFMTNDGGNLRWLAKKGFGHDWAIYCHWDYHNLEWIEAHGDKVESNSNIKKCIEADPEVMKLYRY